MSIQLTGRAGLTQYRCTVSGYVMLLLIILCAAGMLISCAVDPVMDNVRGSIIKYFKGRNYTVTEIEISKIERQPLGQREYMAPKKYDVYIPLITLESSGRGPLTFKDAVIRIRSTDKHGIWLVDLITGIPLT